MIAAESRKGFVMRLSVKSIFSILMGVICLTVPDVYAQSNDDILIFDNQTNDFLLPSYFDTPSAPLPSDDSSQNTGTTQNVPADIDILHEIFGDQTVEATPVVSTPAAPKITTQTFYPTPKSIKQTSQQPLLTPLAPLPQVPEATIPPPKHFQPNSSPYVTRLIAKETGKSKANIQLPKDIRLQFNPNATQLTDPAVKWISAYALHVKKDPTKVVNLRISSQNWSIQQARLGIIMQLLLEKGLPVRQIQIYQSDRDPDSLIVGADINPNLTRAITPEETKRVIKEQKTLIW